MSKIVMFSMKGCANCERAAKMLEEKGVPFKVEKVDENEDAFRHMQLLGLRSLPQFFTANAEGHYHPFCDYKGLVQLPDSAFDSLK